MCLASTSNLIGKGAGQPLAPTNLTTDPDYATTFSIPTAKCNALTTKCQLAFGQQGSPYTNGLPWYYCGKGKDWYPPLNSTPSGEHRSHLLGKYTNSSLISSALGLVEEELHGLTPAAEMEYGFADRVYASCNMPAPTHTQKEKLWHRYVDLVRQMGKSEAEEVLDTAFKKDTLHELLGKGFEWVCTEQFDWVSWQKI